MRVDLPLDKKTVENQPSRAFRPRAAGPSGRRAAGPSRAVDRGPAFSKTRISFPSIETCFDAFEQVSYVKLGLRKTKPLCRSLTDIRLETAW